jgi:hypothetical protein
MDNLLIFRGFIMHKDTGLRRNYERFYIYKASGYHRARDVSNEQG